MNCLKLRAVSSRRSWATVDEYFDPGAGDGPEQPLINLKYRNPKLLVSITKVCPQWALCIPLFNVVRTQDEIALVGQADMKNKCVVRDTSDN